MAVVRCSALVTAVFGMALANRAMHSGRSGEGEFGDRSIARANDGTHLPACWDVKTAGLLFATFTPGGRYLVTATGDLKAQRWNLRKQIAVKMDEVGIPGWHNKWPASAVKYWSALLSHQSPGSPKEHSVKPVNFFLHPIGNDSALAKGVSSFGLAPDGKSFVTGHSGGRVIVRKTNAPHDVLVEMSVPNYFEADDAMLVGFSRDGKRVFAYTPYLFALLVFDAATGALVSEFAGKDLEGCNEFGDMLMDAAWSPDSERVAFIFICKKKHGAKDGVIVFNAATGQKIISFSVYRSFSPRVAWDGEYVVTVNRLGAVFWHGKSGVPSKLVPNPSILEIRDFDIAPDGRYVVFAFAAGSGKHGQLCFRSTKAGLPLKILT